MANPTPLKPRFQPADARDPRESEGAEVIDLATRNVLPQVTQRKKADGLGLAAGVIVVAALGAVTLWSLDSGRNEAQQDPSVQRVPLTPATPAPVAVATPLAAPSAAPVPLPGELSAPAPQPILAAAPGAAPAAAPQGNRYASPTLVFDGGAGSPVGIAAPGGDKAAGGDDFAARVGGVGGGTSSAASSFDPGRTVTQGTLIPAVLETAIDTDVPGYVRAIVSTDVRSFDGKRVLIPRSSRLIGQYKSGLTAGQKRAYVIWQRLIRPDGVSVNIASPAVTFGGETGLPGKVNSHFFERFGSAMLLSVVGGLSTLTGGGANVVIAGGGQSAAAAAVQQGGNVGPTIRVRQGEPIRVFTARDLDFSAVR